MNNNELSKATIMEQELLRGRDVANQLLEVVVDNNNNNKSNSSRKEEEISERSMVMPFAEDAVRKVLRSFTNTLLLLNSDTQHNSLAIHHHQSCNSNNNNKKNSFSNKSPSGCNKRKSAAPTLQSDSSILCEDGNAWRKYGQKKMKNSKYLRSYYKCSYKKEENCNAMRQVERIQEDPPLYRTTYYGHHTCKSSLANHPHTELETASSFESSTLLCFTSDHNTNNTLPIVTKQEPQPFSSSSTKQEEPMEVVSDDRIDHDQYSLSNDYDILSDYELYFNY
ncbi:hypothetical protein PIB30_079187 [Stylosanthes scabra]|uniref:WRKY domain-containing protein n=1 Tax=Stylosanthes scabra TaxID=79078 RepID=A0ABU6RRC5_9FABA|nr:hypothetical protein [Stylosanthes scabra]